MISARLAGLRLARLASQTCHQHSKEHALQQAFRHAHLKTNQRRLQSGLAGAYSSPNTPPPRSLLRRILTGTLTGLLLSSGGFFLGAYFSPNVDALAAAVRHQKFTNAETLSLYVAPDPLSARINSKVVNHAIATALRANPSFTESRPHMRIPEALRPTNLTGGTLAGPGKITVPPLIFSETGGKSLVSLFYLGDQLCGHPGIIHGGMLATLLDEGLARCCFPALPSHVGVTANLKVDYRKPAKAGAYYVMRAETVKVEGRKAWVRGWIEDMVDETKGETATRYVEAEALFIEPRNAKFMRRLHTEG